MANGFMPHLLMHSKQVFGEATPGMKITPPGFLKMLLNNSRPQITSRGIDDGSGHIRELRIKYRTRVPAGKTSTSDNCDVDAFPSYLEDTIAATLFRKYALMIEDETIAQYERDASASVAVGRPATSLMVDQWNAIIEAANGLFADINDDLLVKQNLNWGVNVVSGNNTATTVNFDLNAAQNDLNSGMTLVMAEAMENEINMGNTFVVGSGLVNNYFLQQAAKGVANSGLDTSRLAMPPFFFDPGTSSAWNVNEFGVFERNAAQLVNINRFDGFKGGNKGGTLFGTITLPVIDSLGSGDLSSFTFDYQWKYNDCPTEIEFEGYPRTQNRGWVLILSASYDLYNIPANAYDATDRLAGNNGSLLYEATNA